MTGPTVALIKYTVNGKDMGVAFRIPKSDLKVEIDAMLNCLNVHCPIVLLLKTF